MNYATMGLLPLFGVFLLRVGDDFTLPGDGPRFGNLGASLTTGLLPKCKKNLNEIISDQLKCIVAYFRINQSTRRFSSLSQEFKAKITPTLSKPE